MTGLSAPPAEFRKHAPAVIDCNAGKTGYQSALAGSTNCPASLTAGMLIQHAVGAVGAYINYHQVFLDTVNDRRWTRYGIYDGNSTTWSAWAEMVDGASDGKAWSDLTFRFGWAGTAKYRKVGHRVDLLMDVECINAAAGTVITNVPSGYEPATRRFLTIGQTSGATVDQCWLDLQTDGDIEYDAGTPALGDKIRGLTSYYLN